MADVEEVLEIIEAYEYGYQAGRLNYSHDTNPFKNKSNLFYSWLLGHNNALQTELFEVEETRPN